MEGLISSDRFHPKGPITYAMAEQLLEMPKLKVIQFSDTKPNESTLRILNDVIFKNRKEITLRVYGYSDAWADIGFLRQLPELEKFDWDTLVFGPVEPLYKLKKITHLGLGFIQPKPKISLKFVADFRDTLHSLNIHGDYKDFLTTIHNLNNLKQLLLFSTKLKGFDFLDGLPIESIRNYGGRVESFEYLAKVQTLKKIWIKTNAKLENIDFIAHLTNLEDIELQYVAKIKRFPKCDHLQKLRRIFAFQCNRLEDIEEVKKLNNCNIYISGKKLKNHHYVVKQV